MGSPGAEVPSGILEGSHCHFHERHDRHGPEVDRCRFATGGTGILGSCGRRRGCCMLFERETAELSSVVREALPCSCELNCEVECAKIELGGVVQIMHTHTSTLSSKSTDVNKRHQCIVQSNTKASFMVTTDVPAPVLSHRRHLAARAGRGSCKCLEYINTSLHVQIIIVGDRNSRRNAAH